MIFSLTTSRCNLRRAGYVELMKKNLRHYSVKLLEEVGALVVEVAVLVVTVERFSLEFGVWVEPYWA